MLVGWHDICQVCIGLALQFCVLPLNHSNIHIFKYPNIQMARPFGMMQKWPAVWCNYKYSMMQHRKPFEIQRCGQILLLEKLILLFSIFGEDAIWFQLMFIPINVQEIKFWPIKYFFRPCKCCWWWRNILRVPKGYSALITSDHYAAPAHEPCHHYGYLPLSPLPSIKSRSSVRPS